MPPRSSKVRVRPQHELKPKLKPQHAPKPPHEDQEFLESTPARPLRIMAEYLQPLMQLKKENIGDTIVIFGSARIESRETALARYTRLKTRKHGEAGAEGGVGTPAGLEQCEERAGNVSVLRRSAGAFSQDYLVGQFAGAEAATICDLFWRRAGDYGGGESRGV